MTTDRLHSDEWYRVADTRPRLRAQTSIHRHHYRGEVWYVLENPAHRRAHRFGLEAYQVLLTMDGTRTVQEVWEHALATLGTNAPTQDELIELLGGLHDADAITTEHAPDEAQAAAGLSERDRRKLVQMGRSPLMWRVPLFDPDALLSRLSPLTRRWFTLPGLLLWLGVVVIAIVAAAYHWAELTVNLADRVLAPSNLVILLLVFPCLKVIHELGHGLAVKAFGGEVHETGVVLLVVTPIPYVDASAASVFPRKSDRIAVGAAGMLFETFVAAVALLAWTMCEPGVFRGLLFNIILIAGVTTLVFNANPFLRFDGYAILADTLEIPNLASRGQQYLRWLVERHLLGNRRLPRPRHAPGEHRWLLFHAIGSIICRAIIITSIILFILGEFFTIGVVLAVWATLAWVVLPLVRAIDYLLRGPSLNEVRGRAILASLLIVTLLAGSITVVPLPWRSGAEGVVWAPDESVVRAATDGFVVRLLADPGSTVRAGTPLVECRDPLIEATVRELESKWQELRARRDEKWMLDPAESSIIEDELARVTYELEVERARRASLIIESPAAGVLVLPSPEDLPGRYVQQGEVIAHVLSSDRLIARVVVTQRGVDLVRHRLHGVKVRLCQNVGRVLPATMRREVPEGSSQLPSAALGTAGGGPIPVDPSDADGLAAFDAFFQFDVEFPVRGSLPPIGGRVFVRFEHGWEPLAVRWYRNAQLIWEEHRG